MELMRGVCLSHSILLSSSRFSPRARHSSTSEDVVAVNRSDIFHTTTTKEEGRRPTCGVDEEEGQNENEKKKKKDGMILGTERR